ncbi:hypothetical protein HAX54_048092 [Datura stramonium]|uniref:DUF7705 domain-containing protein n=1 Tax=Datura stramonium TaxID=4076 RepID=A0ABS8RQU2_DATST|nr:hypothetical protein [Datura stramonium]
MTSYLLLSIASDYNKNNVLVAKLVHLVNEADNKLSINDAKNLGQENMDVNTYAAWKELLLGSKCQVQDEPNPWNFWMIMLKSGNMDSTASICPQNGKPSQPFLQDSRFPCFGKGCMNMPRIYHDYTTLHSHKNHSKRSKLKGSFHGTWELDADMSKAKTQNDTSFFSVTWHKNLGKGSWKFHHILKTSSKYPWLMLYLSLSADMDLGPKVTKFQSDVHTEVRRGGGPSSQFYLMDMGSSWKNNGQPCDGNGTTDVTRYSDMIINPDTGEWCNPKKNLKLCPPYHTFANGTRVHRTDEARFPYDAYHMYCGLGNAKYLEEPINHCDAYSNPQAQEILQILPHPVWGEYGYPTTWELDVGRLTVTLLLSGTKPVERHWPSINLGTEIHVSSNQVA